MFIYAFFMKDGNFYSGGDVFLYIYSNNNLERIVNMNYLSNGLYYYNYVDYNIDNEYIFLSYCQNADNKVCLNTSHNERLNYIYEVESGRWKIDVSNKELIYYNRDNNVIRRFKLYDNFGNENVEEVFERKPI